MVAMQVLVFSCYNYVSFFCEKVPSFVVYTCYNTRFFSLVTHACCNVQALFIYCIACLLQCVLVAQKFFFCFACLIVFSLVTMVLFNYICFPTFLLLLCWLCSMWLQWGTRTLDWHKFDKLLSNFGFVGKFCQFAMEIF